MSHVVDRLGLITWMLLRLRTLLAAAHPPAMLNV